MTGGRGNRAVLIAVAVLLAAGVLVTAFLAFADVRNSSADAERRAFVTALDTTPAADPAEFSRIIKPSVSAVDGIADGDLARARDGAVVTHTDGNYVTTIAPLSGGRVIWFRSQRVTGLWPWPYAVVEGVLLLALLVLLSVALRRRVVPAPVSAAPTAAQDVSSRPRDGDRDRLVELCVDARDVTQNPALIERLERTLGEVGVQILHPAGTPFDASLHHAVDRADTGDPAAHNLIASTERSGYVDHGEVVRPPDVVVFQHHAGTAGQR